MNEFIKIYNEQRENGKDQLEAYTFASGKLAFDEKKDIDKLQDLYFHFVSDLSNDVQKEIKLLGDVINE